MMPESNRKNNARKLRREGWSIKSIAAELGAAQSSISLWVKDVPLSVQQQLLLREKPHTPEAIEKRRTSRLANEKAKRDAIFAESIRDVTNLTTREYLLIAASLYWGEGTKKSGIVQFTNGDPRMIRFMLHFFREECQVEESKFRAYIHIHSSLDVSVAERYWQEVTRINKSQFYKTYNKPNVSSKNKRKSLPYGVCDIYVMDARLFYKLNGWAKGIYRNLSN
jgi:predicted transcriptional regulator